MQMVYGLQRWICLSHSLLLLKSTHKKRVEHLRVFCIEPKLSINATLSSLCPLALHSEHFQLLIQPISAIKSFVEPLVVTGCIHKTAGCNQCQLVRGLRWVECMLFKQIKQKGTKIIVNVVSIENAHFQGHVSEEDRMHVKLSLSALQNDQKWPQKPMHAVPFYLKQTVLFKIIQTLSFDITKSLDSSIKFDEFVFTYFCIKSFELIMSFFQYINWLIFVHILQWHNLYI